MQISIYSLEGFVSLPNERFRVEALSACGPDFLDKCCKNNNLAPQKIWSKIFGLLLGSKVSLKMQLLFTLLDCTVFE